MSESVPLLRFGQRVRVMQTTDMVKAGLANRTGIVMENQRTHYHHVRVSLDDDALSDASGENVELKASALMLL